MEKSKNHFKLRTILITLIAVIISSTLVVSGIISFQMFERLMVEKTANARVDVLMQISEKVSAINSNSQILANLYFYNQNITTLYQGREFTEEEIFLIYQNFHQIDELAGMAQSSANIDFYYTFAMMNGYVFSSNPNSDALTLEDYRNKIWFVEVVEHESKLISTYADNEGRNIISIARSLHDERGEFIGLFLFNIYEENFSRTFEPLVEYNEIYIVDNNGNIVSHSNKDLLGIRFYNMTVMNEMFQEGNHNIIEKSQQEYLFSIFRNQELNWIMVEEIPIYLLLGEVQFIRNRMILIGAIIFIISMLICIYISQKTTRPLKDLVHALEDVGKSEENNTPFEVAGWHEINVIRDEYNYMNQRIKNLVDAIKQTEQDKRIAEMGFMQAQMSPHFLYNTLFSIRCLVDMGSKEEAIGITDSFTSILKYILSYQDEYVDIAHEIKFLEDYKILQKYRYGTEFQMEIHCLPELYSKKILRMMIQPLVENSLFHGFSGEMKEIKVSISFELMDNDMVITVTDNGIGFTEVGYGSLSDKLQNKKQSNMIGMNNIRDRIKMNYGSKYGLTIDINYEEGAKVILKVPIID